MGAGPAEPANAKMRVPLRRGMAIQKVCVLGAGNMGSGIAQAFAQAGFAVSMRDVKPELVHHFRRPPLHHERAGEYSRKSDKKEVDS